MTQKAQLLRSNIAGHVPGAGSLLAGELAVNFPDKKLWAGDASGNPIDLLGNLLNQANAATGTALQNLLVSVKMFGATGDGTTDDTAAFLAARTYCQTNKRALFVPGGKYVLSQRIAWTVGAVTIYGEGQGLSVLSWTAAAATRGLLVTLDQDIHPCTITGLTLETYGTTGTALYIDASPQVVGLGSLGLMNGGITVNRTAPRFVVRDVNMRGGGGNPFTAYWDYGVAVVAAIMGIVDGCSFEGGYTYNGGSSNYPYPPSAGFSFGDTSCKGQPTQFMVTRCTVMGAKIGVFTTCVQGVHIEMCDFVGVDNGVLFDDHLDTGGAQPHCAVVNCHINAVKSCVYVHNGSELLVQACDLYRCSDDLPATPTVGYGIYIDGTWSTVCVITGNNFSNSSAAAPMQMIHLNNVRNGLVANNTGRKYTSAPVAGLAIDATCSNIRVGDNHWTVDVGASGTYDWTVLDNGVRTILPGAYIMLTKTANQTIPVGTPTIATWDGVQAHKSNNVSWWSSSTPNVITIAGDALYRVSANVVLDNTAGGTHAAQILAGGVPQVGSGQVIESVTGTFHSLNLVSAPLPLLNGSTVSLQLTASAGCTLLANGQSWLCVERLADL